MFRALILIFASLMVTQAFAASNCNSSGADPMSCKSRDGKYQILISANRNLTGLAIATNTFCTHGYLKLNGVEVLGAYVDPSERQDLGIDWVEAVTSELGVRLANPATKKVIIPETAVGFVLSEKGKAMVSDGVDTGHVFIFNNQDAKLKTAQRTAWMYLYGGGVEKAFINLVCE